MTTTEPASAEETGDVVFWGEWEAPSRVVAEFPDGGSQTPRFLHEPVVTQPPDHPGVQNTDPYVFGSRFLYSNCKQNTRKGPRRTQRLDAGSLILFGSHLGGGYVLDTLFVVGDSTSFNPTVFRRPDLDPGFVAVTGQIMAPWLGGDTFRLYEGATPEHSVDGMFSFVPCLPAEPSPSGFARPSIELDGIVNPRLKQGLKFSWVSDTSAMRVIWERVAQQVLDHNLALAVNLSSPRGP